MIRTLKEDADLFFDAIVISLWPLAQRDVDEAVKQAVLERENESGLQETPPLVR